MVRSKDPDPLASTEGAGASAKSTSGHLPINGDCIVAGSSAPRARAASGHFDPFPPPGLSDRCRFGEETFAGTEKRLVRLESGLDGGDAP
jgi:hypothetical protein